MAAVLRSRLLVFSVVFYASSSLGAVFANKACLTHFHFSFPFALMLLEAIVSVSLLFMASRLFPTHVSIEPFKRENLPGLLGITALFICNVSCGLFALTLVNIPMFSALRRLSVIFVMGMEYILLSKVHSRRVSIAVIVLAAGAVISAFGDATFSARGYLLVSINNMLSACYLTLMKRVLRDSGMNPTSLFFHSARLTIAPLAVIATASGNLSAAARAFATRPDLSSSSWFLPALLGVAVSAFCVNLATSMCTDATSPLTTSVAGQVKTVLQTLLGFFSWGYVATPLNIFGLVVALFGQLAFGYFKYWESRRALGDVVYSLANAKSGSMK